MEDSPTYQYLASLTTSIFNQEMQAWKENGGKIIACMYNQVPDEIITAAGMMAYRPRAVGDVRDELADGRFTQVNCSLVKNFYDSAKRGHFDFIDGLVVANSCDHIRKLYENWKDTIDLDYYHLICFPKSMGEAQVDILTERFKAFKNEFEAHFDLTITDEALTEAIELHNQIRELQSELYSLRAQAHPPISGSEILRVMIAGTCMPRAKYAEMLETLIQECKMIEAQTPYKARVILYGGEIDSPQLLEAIESQGAMIVGDSLGSFGTRSFEYSVSLEGDLVRNLAQALLMDREGEPRIHGSRLARQDNVAQKVKTFDADGVIHFHIPMCDLWGYERVMFHDYADKNEIPLLALDTEYIFSNTGQTKTRVQAFVESLSEGGR